MRALEYFYVVGEAGESRNADFVVDIDKLAGLFDAFSI